ncbi:MAG TPA: NADH-ubiquinone oxidoreductase-F iron-sulfur binding region domain-containing protein [Chloroflexota bacterium]|nr:NADH-ubiquinone oxidoreductase-F iron-sulfur binding region domain-containing protein [Chloroflexota bacterium]
MIEDGVLSGPPADAGAESYESHIARLGPLTEGGTRLIETLDRSGLRGRGGAAFPVGAKWGTLAGRKKGKAVVLANGAEGEPLSHKDRLLMETRPHLVLDGAFCAAQTLGADRVVLYINQDYHRAREALRVALSERREPDSIALSIVQAPARYVAGEETAAVHCINENVALPQSKPPRPFERGVDGKPTLVQNVETLAYVALIARRSDAWFRGLGREGAAGAMLITVGGSVRRPGVFEVPQGISVAEALELAGAETAGISAVLLGGYYGGWVPALDVGGLPLEAAQLRARGRSLGCGVVFAAPADACGVVETASILAYLAGESARQCGPCVFGLRAMSDAVTRVAANTGSAQDLMRLTRWTGEIRGRGACNHPDGASGFLESALATFGSEFVRHVESHSCGMELAPVTPSERVRERVRT